MCYFWNYQIKYSILCHLFYNTAQYEMALKYNAIAINENNNKDKRGVGAALSNRGMILHKVGKEKEAIDCFYEALAIFKEIDFSFGIATSYNNIGYTLGLSGKIIEGIDILNNGLDYVEANSFKEARLCKGYLEKSRGELNVILGDLKAAVTNFNAAIEIFEVGYKAEEAEALMHKGKLYRTVGRTEEGTRILCRARNLAKKVGYSDVVEKCSILLSDS